MSLIFHLILLTLSTTTSFPLPLWPKPTSLSWSNHTFTHLSPTFKLHLPPTPHPSLLSSSHHYTNLILSTKTTLPHHPLSTTPSSPPLHSLTITVRNLSSPLHPACDESYSLSLHPPSASLVSVSPWGALHGLATLSQLAFFDPATRSIFIPAGLVVEDRPMFGHRGLLLDTSRNFYPVQDLMRTVEAMAWNKMNVFHWHITDSQSFPVTLPSEPELARKGAYGPDMVYSVDDVRRVVEFGFERGVRVVPEFDAPGHTASWAGAYPEIVTCANRFWAPPGSEPLAAEPSTGQLNPLHPKTYEVYLNVLRDAADLFPDPFMHAGADEVSPGCWKTDQAIQSFLSNDGTLSQLLEIFINTTHPYIADELHRTVVYWEDVLLGDKVRVDPSILPPESTVLQTWNNGPNNTKRIVEAGYRVIVSSADFYYLDCGHGGFVGNDSRYDQQIDDPSLPPFNYLGGTGGSWCGPFKTWQRIYDYDITYGLTKEEAKLVLGGEVALWSEQADPTVLDSRLWPRASAMAESLWSGNRDRNGKKRYAEATDRLNQWRNRMVARGVNAEPIQPLWCLYHPGMCNLVQ